MDIYLVSTDIKMVSAWEKYFSNCENVSILNKRILSVEYDTIASAGNCFGIMDGGLDLSISMRYGYDFQIKLLHLIQSEFYGEIPIGSYVLVETDNRKNVIYAPSMRVPMKLPKKSINAYLAFRAVLMCSKSNNLNRIAVPAFCTGVGQMDFDTCAFQMFEAYKNIVLCEYKKYKLSWMHFQKQHNKLSKNKNIDLQY